MRPAAFLCAGLAALAAAGCVESDGPPFAPGDAVFEPALLGEWAMLGKQERGGRPLGPAPRDATHRIERAGGGTYRLVGLVGEKEEEEFVAFRLGGRYFVAWKRDGGRYAVDRLTVAGDYLKLWTLDVWGVLRAHPAAAKHKEDGPVTVLTGGTAEVRAFLHAHADDPGVWRREYLALQRVGGLKVAAGGLTGRKQRTLDYWSGVRLALQDPAPPVPRTRADLAGLWSDAGREVEFLAAEGVDPDAATCGALAAELCQTMARYTDERRPPDDPLGALVRESTGGTAVAPAALPAGREAALGRVRGLAAELEAAREKLSERYGCELLPIR